VFYIFTDLLEELAAAQGLKNSSSVPFDKPSDAYDHPQQTQRPPKIPKMCIRKKQPGEGNSYECKTIDLMDMY